MVRSKYLALCKYVVVLVQLLVILLCNVITTFPTINIARVNHVLTPMDLQWTFGAIDMLMSYQWSYSKKLVTPVHIRHAFD